MTRPTPAREADLLKHIRNSKKMIAVAQAGHREAIENAIDEKVTHGKIATEAKLTRSRVGQIAKEMSA